MGARAAGMGYTSSTLRDEWSLFNNVAGLAGLTKPQIGFALESAPYLPGANRLAAIFSGPLGHAAVGGGLFHFGDDLYNEQMVSLGFANHVGIASLGARLNYVQYHAEGFGTRRALAVDFGGIAEITPQVFVGAYIVNLNQARIATSPSEQLPTKLVAGLGFQPSKKAFLAIEVSKDLDYDLTLKCGLEYEIIRNVAIRTGFNIHPDAGFFGFGISSNRFKVAYALQYNQQLSVVQQTSISYRLEKKRKRGHTA
jgi:hypothetical protein